MPAAGLPGDRQPETILDMKDRPRRADAGSAVPETTADELRPVEVPIPSEQALRFYRSGMWLWAFDVCWGLIVPAVIVFTGFSAVLRSLARRLGHWWFPTVGLYVVLYLAIVFLINLPLDYYVGFVRQHAYGLSNQSLAKWLIDSLLSVGIEMIVGFAFAWVPYLLLARARAGGGCTRLCFPCRSCSRLCWSSRSGSIPCSMISGP